MNLAPGLDPEETTEILTGFVDAYVTEAGADGVVVGLSGGVDSATTAALCVEALEADRVLGVLMPTSTTPDDDIRDARGLADQLGIDTRTHDLDDVVEAYDALLEGQDPEALGNVKARARMVVLYWYANRLDRLVAGTGNKSELLVGYFTKYGDGGVDILPLGDLYKTQVTRLAEHLGVPEAIRDKPPSAGLVRDQTDEDDLGLTYQDLDPVLRGIELGYDDATIAEETGTPAKEVERVRAMEERHRHKRNTPMVPKLGARSVGTDWREKVL